MRTPSLLTATLALAAVSAGLLTACGQTEDERARRAAEDYADTVIARDFPAVCELFGPAYRQRLGGPDGCVESQRVQWAQPVEELRVVKVLAKKRRGLAKLEIYRQGFGPSPLTLLLKRPERFWLIVGQR
jgi:hypothetical protein